MIAESMLSTKPYLMFAFHAPAEQSSVGRGVYRECFPFSASVPEAVSLVSAFSVCLFSLPVPLPPHRRF